MEKTPLTGSKKLAQASSQALGLGAGGCCSALVTTRTATARPRSRATTARTPNTWTRTAARRRRRWHQPPPQKLSRSLPRLRPPPGTRAVTTNPRPHPAGPASWPVRPAPRSAHLKPHSSARTLKAGRCGSSRFGASASACDGLCARARGASTSNTRVHTDERSQPACPRQGRTNRWLPWELTRPHSFFCLFDSSACVRAPAGRVRLVYILARQGRSSR